MKKLFAIFILISSLISAQETSPIVTGNLPGEIPQDQNYGRNGKGVIIFQQNADSTWTKAHSVYMSPNDTLVNNDSSSYDFKNRTYINEINIYNPAANADTVVPYYYDKGNNRWTTQMSAVYDLSIADWLTADATTGLIYIIIPAKTSKRFRLAEPMASKVKFKPQVTTGQASDTLIFYYIEKQ